MRIIMFQPQFVENIRTGKKGSTIRDKARCKPGDVLSLRHWENKPYRSKQQEILPPQICKAVTPVRILCQAGDLHFFINLGLVGLNHLNQLAWKEGFTNASEMKAWFWTNKKMKTGDVYEGELIEWK